MSRPIFRTGIVLLLYCTIQVFMALGLLAWEFYAVGFPKDAALITAVIKLAWALQPWPFLLSGIVITAIVMFLFGHFFAGPQEELERIRRRDWDAEERRQLEKTSQLPKDVN